MSVLTVDLGASSGRVLHTYIENGIIGIKELHRFKNGMTKAEDGHYYWDIDGIFNNIKIGIANAVKENIDFDSVGIDTWGVDYVLLDKEGNLVRKPFGYRDRKNEETAAKFDKMSIEGLYGITGLANLTFNTTYQLISHIELYPQDFEKADKLLFVPDYLHYLLTGVAVTEYTIASTSQLIDVKTRSWSKEILNDVIGIREDIFCEIKEPGTIVGDIKADLAVQLGLKKAVKVILPPSHDTASAVVSAPIKSETDVYISSGTWSLMGIETVKNYPTAKSMEYNFTHEGGYNGTIRFLKNIMGLWLIQEVKREDNDKYSFDDYLNMAVESEPFAYFVDPNNDMFIKPDSMKEAVAHYVKETTGTDISEAQIVRCIYDSLAMTYNKVVQELEEITGTNFDTINIVGGGTKDEFLNQLAADVSGKKVNAGPTEATSLGNAITQFISLGLVKNIDEARELIKQSFNIKTYIPSDKINTNSDSFEKIYGSKVK